MTLTTDTYIAELKNQIKASFGDRNIHAYPELKQISINVGCGAGAQKRYESKDRDTIVKLLEMVTGQKPTMVASRKSIAGFKLRAGEMVGVKVTLRGKRMYDFLLRFVFISLPRTRDFRGLSSKFIDKQGNYSLGIKSTTIFPEIGFDVDISFGMQVNFVFKNVTTSESETFLKLLKLPITA